MESDIKYSARLLDLIQQGALPGKFDWPYPQPPKCANCNDTELVSVFVVKGGPYASSDKGKYLEHGPHGPGWYTGKSEIDPCPVCTADRLKDYYADRTGLKGLDLTIGMSDFQTSGMLAAKSKARDTCARYVAMNRQPRGFVTLWGEYGAGKTLLLKAMTNAFRHVGILSRYITMGDLLAEIRERFGTDMGTEEVVRYYREVRFLAVDELDRINLTGWVLETVHRLLGSRYDDRHEILTAVAMNPKPDHLPAEWGYLVSRMYQGDVVEVPGPDMRPIVKEVE